VLQKKKKASAGSKKRKNAKTYSSARNKSRTYSSSKAGRNTRSTASNAKNRPAGRQNKTSAASAAKSPAVKKQAAAKQTVSAGKKRPVSIKKIIAVVVILAAAAALGIAAYFYLNKAFFYRDHFFEGTVINGTDCSLMTAEEAEQTIQNTLNEYSYTFTDHEGRSSTVTAPELSVTYTDTGEVEQLLGAQKYLSWAFRKDENASYNVTSGYTYSKEALDSWISSLPCLNDGVAPTDAYVREKEDSYLEIVPETYGDLINADTLRGSIVSAVDEGRPSSDLSGLDCFIRPAVFADDPELVSYVEETNAETEHRKIAEGIIEDITDVELLFSSYKDKVYLNQDILKGMLEEDEEGWPVISRSKVMEWVENWACDRGFDNEPNLFVTHGGKLMNVENGPYRGWLLDIQATAERTWDAVLNKEHGVLFPVTVDDEGNPQSGSSYVEINILKQTMWYYRNGEQIVETPVVTGDCTKDMDTPTDGVWAIYMKMTDYTMRGPVLYDGTYEYITHVDYWMPFNGQIGIHDMQSRDAFGGDIYKGNGSHGCVNTPFENAETIFMNADIGTPVVVHS